MISEYLTDSPLTKRQIAERAGVTVRETELLIHAARLEGYPIVSDGDGYRLATSAQEVEACAARLRRRAANQFVTARALRKSARRMEARTELSLWGEG